MFRKFFAKRRLRALLSDPKFQFRSFDRCCAATGFAPAETRTLLYAVGARPGNRDETSWGLVSRVGARQSRNSTAFCD